MSDDVIGCGDSGCIFGRGPGTRYGGQHTNGGCRCLEDDRTGRPFSFETRKRLRDWIRALRQQRDEARAEAIMLREARNAWMIHSEAARRRGRAEIAELGKEREALRAEVERLRGWVASPCTELGCRSDSVPGPCPDVLGRECDRCCPMHRCGGEA